MKFSCPYCKKELNLMDLQHESDLHAIIQMLNSFGKYSSLVGAYTELFDLSPLKTKAKKWRLLLEEMKRLFDSESFTHGKKTYPITQAGIAGALSIVGHRHFDEPLKSHGYLKAIMVTVSEREAQAAGRTAEKDLRKKEDRLMLGSRDETPPGSQYPVPMSGSRNGESLTPEVVYTSGYSAPVESVEPPPVKFKAMPRTHLTEAERETNRLRVQGLLKDIGG